MEYECWASDLGNTRVIKSGTKPPTSDIGDWRRVFSGPQPQCMMYAQAFERGYNTSELGEWEGGSTTDLKA